MAKRPYSEREDAAILAASETDLHLSSRMARSAAAIRARRAVLKGRRSDYRRPQSGVRAAAALPDRFARPDWFDEGDPRLLARARPSLAGCAIRNAGRGHKAAG